MGRGRRVFLLFLALAAVVAAVVVLPHGDPPTEPAPSLRAGDAGDGEEQRPRGRAAAPVAVPADGPRPPDVSVPANRLEVRAVDAVDRTPLPDATFEIADADGAAFEPPPTTLAGRAIVVTPRTGRVTVTARAAGHVRATADAEIRAGATTEVEVALGRGVAVQGVVVAAEGGSPVAGAAVEVVEGGSLGGRTLSTSAPPHDRATTDARGLFRLDRVPPGKMVTVLARAPGFVAGGVTVEIAATAASPTEVRVRLERGGVVRGVVRDRGGRPVAGATAVLAPADQPSLLEDPERETSASTRSGVHRSLRAACDADGVFAIEGVPLGAAHFAVAYADGFATSVPVPGVVVDPASPERSVDLVLRAPGALAVRVLDAAGAPVPGAAVEVRWKSRTTTVTTDADGRAVAPGLQLRSWIVTARAAGHPMLERFHAVAEGATTDVELRLPQGCAIEGVLVDDAGNTVARGRVEASRPVWEDGYDGLPKSEGEAVSDAQGRFRIDGLLAGPHRLAAQEKGRPVTGETGPVTAPAAGARVVSVRRASLRFRLAVPPGSPPPVKLHVHIGSLVHRPAWSDGPVTIDSLDPETSRVEFCFAGFVSFDRSVDLRPGETTDLGTIALDAGSPLRGRVVDASGRGVAGAVVSTGDSLTPSFQEVAADASGAFTLEHLADGATPLDVRADGFLGREVEMERTGGPIVLNRGGLLRGLVRRPDGTPVPDAHVQVRDEAARARGDDMDDRQAWRGSDARGVFEVRALPGRYTVTVELKEIGKAVVTRVVETDLVEGETTPLTIDVGAD